MSRIVDGLREATCIFEAAVWTNSVRVTCSLCPNINLFEPAGLWWHFDRRGWDHNFRSAPRHLYCLMCAVAMRKRVRPQSLEAVMDKPAKFLPPPDDREWKRAMSRFRA